MISFTIQEINSILKGELIGDCSEKIYAPEQIEKAKNGQITFIGNRKFAKLWSNSNASAAIVDEKIELEPGENKAFIKVKNADLAMAKLLEAFQPEAPHFETDIHPTAVIDGLLSINNVVTVLMFIRAFANEATVSLSILLREIPSTSRLEFGASNIVARRCHPLVVIEGLLQMSIY